VIRVRSNTTRVSVDARILPARNWNPSLCELVHHSTIFEINVESYRRRTAIEKKQPGAGRPAQQATIKNNLSVSARDNQHAN